MLYRILLTCTLFLAFVAFTPSSAVAQEDGGCYQCNPDNEKCDVIPDEYTDHGCLADGGGTVICRGGECSNDCETSEGSCKIIMTLAPFGITADDRIMFQKADMEFATVLPVPGEPGYYADWSCEGELRALYQRTALGFFEEVPAEPLFLMVGQ